MPKTKVTVKYRKAKTSPSARKKKPKVTELGKKELEKMSPLAIYVERHLADGLTISELMHRFQNEVCDHPMRDRFVIAMGPNTTLTNCRQCGLISKSTVRGRLVSV